MQSEVTGVGPFCIIDWPDERYEKIEAISIDSEAVVERVSLSKVTARHPQGFLASFRASELFKLGAHPGLTPDTVIDASLLARAMLPTQESFDLAALAVACNISGDCQNAGERAQVAAKVWLKLVEILFAQPLGVLSELSSLLEPVGNPLHALVNEAAKQALRKGFGSPGRSLENLLPSEGSAARAPQRKPKEPPASLDVESACNIFARDGALASQFDAYEYRSEQVRMVREICDALNDSMLLMVEAGTGTGKSLAYLVPAIIWSIKNNDPVIISTCTKNLQAQLFEKDLPFLEKALGGAFRYALIKGRANYLCLRKFLSILRHPDLELSLGERMQLLPIITWLPNTSTGDIAENSAFTGGMESDLWSRLSTRPDECMGPKCRWARRCFVRKARAIAQQADIVVANHATVFSEAGMPSVALPPYQCIVFDEAHNVEDVATDCFSITAAPWQLPRILNRLFRGRRDGAGRGLFTNLRFQLHRARAVIAKDATQVLSNQVKDALGLFAAIRSTSESFFESMRLNLRVRQNPTDRVRYSAAHRPENWPEIAQSASELIEVVEALASALEQIQKETSLHTKHTEEAALSALAEVAADIASQAQALRAFTQSLGLLIEAKDEGYVYWVQPGMRAKSATLCGAPVDIGKVMEEAIYSRMRTAIFTSATLTVAGNFDFMRDRLGMRGEAAKRLHTIELGSSFDFHKQVLAAVPAFLPEPRINEQGFLVSFCDLATDVLRATHGRGLVLFTSHAMLRKAHKLMQPALTQAGIRVLAQGIDGDRARLARMFRKETSSVLLGTQSFWEGLDVPGESLTCLIVAKLPFRPHTDPIVSARCELIEAAGKQPFMEYTVPDAAIRLKQGFGRLIRSTHDRGIVLTCDSRIATKRYGRAFTKSLPTPTSIIATRDALITAIRNFLAP